MIYFRDFDNGGEGVAYHDVDPSGISSYSPRAETGVEIAFYDPFHVLNVYPTEYLKFTVNVLQSGTYSFFMRSLWGEGKFHLEMDGKVNYLLKNI